VDAGCEYHGYCSDITRTFPVNGTFSPAQRDVYDVVLACNKKCIEVNLSQTPSICLSISLSLSLSISISQSQSQSLNLSQSQSLNLSRSLFHSLLFQSLSISQSPLSLSLSQLPTLCYLPFFFFFFNPVFSLSVGKTREFTLEFTNNRIGNVVRGTHQNWRLI
jgi:Metallopeptidase family M24